LLREVIGWPARIIGTADTALAALDRVT